MDDVKVAPAPRAMTGGPRDTDKIIEHIAGWVLVVVLAMLVTAAHLM